MRALSSDQRAARAAIEAGLIAVVLGVLAFVGRSAWFFGDDWAFLLDRQEHLAQGDYLRLLFLPHNEHLSTLPVLLYTLLYRLVGVDHFMPYFACSLAAHGLVLLGARTLLARLGVGLPWRLAAVLWLGLGAGGAENLLWAFQVGFMGAVAAGIWAVVLLYTGERHTRRDVGASVLFGIGLLTASTVVPFIAACSIALLVDRAVRRFAVVVVGPGALYGLWYLTVGRANAPDVAHPASVMPPFFTTGLTFALDRIVGITGLGLVVAAGAFLLLRKRVSSGSPPDRVTAVLFLVPVLTFGLAAYSRAYLGLDGAKAGRYVYATAAALVPVLSAAGARWFAEDRRARPIIGVLLAVALGTSASNYVSFRAGWLAYGSEVRPTLELALLLDTAPLVDPQSAPDPRLTPNATYRRIERLVAEGRWSPETAWTDEQRAATSLRIGVTQKPDIGDEDVDSIPATLEFVSGAIEPTGRADCWRVTADWPDGTVRVRLGQRGVLDLGWPKEPVTLRVVDAAGSELASRKLDPSLGQWVGFETLVGSLELETAAPRLELCNALR